MGAFGHHVKEPVGGVLGMAGHEADQVLAGDLVDVLQQIRKVVIQPQVVAVGVDVLAQEGNVLVPGLHQLPDLLQNALGITAALPAPDIGHDTVGAEVVAAVHDADPCLHALFPHHRDALGNGAVLIVHGKDPLPGLVDLPQKLWKFPQGMGAEHQIHMTVGFLHPLRDPLLLGHAAAQADHLLRVFLFRVGEDA